MGERELIFFYFIKRFKMEGDFFVKCLQLWMFYSPRTFIFNQILNE